MYFCDDSGQGRPTRPGMRSLTAVGGIRVPNEALPSLEAGIERCCSAVGFPEGEEFKWSPGRELWMHDNLVDEARHRFFSDVLTELKEASTSCIVCASELACRPANGGLTPEQDVTCLFLERVNSSLARHGRLGIVVSDQPSGGQKEEKRFHRSCHALLRDGSSFVATFDCLALPVVFPVPSELVRLVQAADLIVGCTLARVSGERIYSPQLFERIAPMFERGGCGLVGGSGLKLHPDYKFANLYHWLVGDSDLVKPASGQQLPIVGRAYAESEWVVW